MAENEMNTFDDAEKASTTMFDNEEANANETVEEIPQAAQDAVDPSQMQEAVDLASEAAQKAADENNRALQLEQELAALKEQNASLQKAIQEQSAATKEAVVAEVLSPPTLEKFDTFDDEETINQKLQKYQQDTADFYSRQAKDGVMKELEPFISEVKTTKQQNERNAAISALSASEGFTDAKDLAPQLDGIVNNQLSAMDAPATEKYTLAYLLVKGAEAVKNGGQRPSTQSLLDAMKENPELENELEKMRISKLKNGQQVPNLSSSNGAASVALNIPERPKNFDEARDASFGNF